MTPFDPVNSGSYSLLHEILLLLLLLLRLLLDFRFCNIIPTPQCHAFDPMG